MEPERAYEEEMAEVGMAVDFNTEELLRAQALLYQHTHSFISGVLIKCATELGIPDAINDLGGRPVTLSELSASLSELHPSKIIFLPRLMRLLAHLGVFATQSIADGENEERYALTPLSKLLVKKSPVSMASFTRFTSHPIFYESIHRFSDWLRGPSPTIFEEAYGRSCWKCIAQDPELNHMFNDAMACKSSAEVRALIRDCRDVFQGLSSLVDVGGGNGATAKAIAEAFPGLKCTVFDLPHVVAMATPESCSRITVVAGDMFGTIPPADAVLLKRVLHNWNDADCLRILEKCKEAVPSDGGKIVVVDMVIGSGTCDEELLKAQLYNDIVMMATFGSSERDEEQWRGIFCKAGFSSYKIKHALGLVSLIEIYP